MKCYIYEPRGWEPTSRCAASLRVGLDKLGIEWANGPWREPTPDDADFVIHFGWIKKWLDQFPNYAYPRNDRIREARERGVPVLCVERGCIAPLGRDKWHLMAWNGLNGRGDWGPPKGIGILNMDRWGRVFAPHVCIQPRQDRPDGDLLLLGQVPRDASLDTAPDYQRWLHHMADWLQAKGAVEKRRAVFRPHPKARDIRAGDLPIDDSPSVDVAIGRAAATYAWNSTAGVESVLAGVPHFAHDEGSMASQVLTHSFDLRSAWARRIAYAQWLDAEIQSGEALEHLLPVAGLAVPA